MINKESAEITIIRKRLKAIVDKPKFDRSSSEIHYAQDVPFLLSEIEQLQELMKDREADLEFEYNERVAAERELERLKEEYGN